MSPSPCWGHPEDLSVPVHAWSPLSESGLAGSSGSPRIKVEWEWGLPRLPSTPPHVRGQRRNSVPGCGKLPGSGRWEGAPSGPGPGQGSRAPAPAALTTSPAPSRQ